MPMFNSQPFSQRDPRWSGLQLGFGDSDSTLGRYGCTVTCVAMLANGYGFNETPASMNDRFKSLGLGVGYTGATRNLIVIGALNQARPGMKYVDRVYCDTVPAPMDRINAELDAGRAILIQLDQSPNPDFQEHWVLLIGRTGGDYLILDPWPVPTQGITSIFKNYGFTGNIAQIIRHCVFFDGPAKPPQPTAPLTVVVNNDPDIVAIGGLALRDKPSFASTVLKRIAANTELALREAEASARAKLGAVGQWLNVATNGSEGFVAAWLVHAKEADRKMRAASRGLPKAAQAPITLVVNRPLKASTAKNPPSPSLRSKPSIGKILAELKPNTPLSVVEAQTTALKKIGVRGKWIKVRDNKINVGYVAGIYVHIKKTKIKAKG